MTRTTRSSARAGADDRVGTVPPANEPGHHPPEEQDKPLDRRPTPRTAGRANASFPFRFSGPAGLAAQAVTVGNRFGSVEVRDGELVARYGPWTLRTPLDNIADVEVTGPYQLWKVIGPPHLSMTDRGLTFGTNTERGVCIRFHEPVTCLDPTGRVLRHPGLTVTVADVEGLANLLEHR